MSANPPYGYDYTSLAPPAFATPFVTARSDRAYCQPFPETIPSLWASPGSPTRISTGRQFAPITGVPAFFHGNVPPYAESFTLPWSANWHEDRSLPWVMLEPGAPSARIGIGESRQSRRLSGAECNEGRQLPYVALWRRRNLHPFQWPTVQGTRGPYSSQFEAITYQKTIGNSNYNALQSISATSAGRWNSGRIHLQQILDNPPAWRKR